VTEIASSSKISKGAQHFIKRIKCTRNLLKVIMVIHNAYDKKLIGHWNRLYCPNCRNNYSCTLFANLKNSPIQINITKKYLLPEPGEAELYILTLIKTSIDLNKDWPINILEFKIDISNFKAWLIAENMYDEFSREIDKKDCA